MSHSHADAPLAARISEALEESGPKVWDPDRDLLPGDNWAGKVARALEESEAMVALLTPAAVKSPYVKRNIEHALGAKNYANRLVPVAIGNPDQCRAGDIPWILRRMPWVALESGESGSPKVEPIADAIPSRA